MNSQDLAGLREDVRRAFAKMDRDCPRGYEVAEEWQTIRAELLRLNAELAAMKRRIAEAPTARVDAPYITTPLQLRDADPMVCRLLTFS